MALLLPQTTAVPAAYGQLQQAPAAVSVLGVAHGTPIPWPALLAIASRNQMYSCMAYAGKSVCTWTRRIGAENGQSQDTQNQMLAPPASIAHA